MTNDVHRPALLAYAERLCRYTTLTPEDVLQDAYVSALQIRPDAPSELRLMYSLVHRSYVDQVRSGQRMMRAAHVREIQEDDATTEATQPVTATAAGLLAQLAPAHAEILLRMAVLQQTAREVAAATGLSEAAVWQAYRRIRQSAQALLGE